MFRMFPHLLNIMEFYAFMTEKMFPLYFCTENKICGKISAMSNTNKNYT